MGAVVTLYSGPHPSAAEPAERWTLARPAPIALAGFRLGMLRACHGRPERPLDGPAVKRGHQLAVNLLGQPLIDWLPRTPRLLRRRRRHF